MSQPAASDLAGCPECAGDGCPRCHWRGRRRAQLLLTVANRDTGAVASHRVTPADLEPRRDPAGGWVADLTPRVRELAATVAAALDPEPLLVRLPPAWRPDLPATDRYAHLADALADMARRRPWWLWLGGTAAVSPVDPAVRLARLCHLADLLLLDLVVEARRHGDGPRWAVRYEVPGSPVPAGPFVGHPDLATALTRTDVPDALAGLAERGLTAPARLLEPEPAFPGAPAAGPLTPLPAAGSPIPVPGGPPNPVPSPGDDDDPVRRLERRIVAELVAPVEGTDRPGAQATWRDGHWWYTGLRASARPGGPHGASTLFRVTEPPDLAYLGEVVPGRPCPDCRADNPTRPCRCVGGGRAAGDCDRCGGTGRRRRSVLRCATCGGNRRLRRSVLVTITDLRHRVVHLGWHAGTPEDTCEVATAPGGRPVVQLPERYRLGAWARVFGVRPEDLAEADGGHALPRELRDGYVTLPWSGADPVGEYLRAVGPGLPAGRLVVTAVRPDVPPLAELVRLATGLDLALHVSLLDLRQHAGHPLRADGRYWSVELRPRDAPVHPADLPTRPSLAAALDDCLSHLADDLAGLVPADPDLPLPVPAAPARPVPDDPEPVLLRLAAAHPGRAVTLRLTRAGCTAHRHDDDAVRRLDLPAPAHPESYRRTQDAARWGLRAR
ncbi:hypothetical protein [Micromonospora cathayae]|uniref:Uncharacterized protein n=1 Tax=Micromonospora cathayae TaxID=3028804 RepID=A0ABY7ZWU0_9ACTN|nr:hypothetical protein [Micromonospora sp. HUAS 3]WDZ87358.1 hypothetical protein PVK37_13565 [Micromonospora sp. HUAS 3]